jgi:hypothetical protein
MSKGIVRGLAIVGAIVVIGKIVKNAIAVCRFCKWAKGKDANTLHQEMKVILHVQRRDGGWYKMGPISKPEAQVILEGLKNAGASVQRVVVCETIAC